MFWGWFSKAKVIGRGGNKEQISRLGGGGDRDGDTTTQQTNRIREIKEDPDSRRMSPVNNLFLFKNRNVFTLTPFITAVVAAAYRHR